VKILRAGDPLDLLEAQEQLHASQGAHRQAAETQAAILNALPANVALIDPDGVILAVNESWRRFATSNGMEGAESGVGQNYLHVCECARGDHAEESQAAATGIRRVLCGEADDFAIEYPCHSPTEQRWFDLTVAPVREDRAGAVVMHVDVTKRRQAEDAAQRSQKRLRGLIDGLGPSIFVGLLTPQGILIEANLSALEAGGAKPEDVLGMPFEETIWWAYSKDVQQQLREAIERASQGVGSRYDVRVRAAEDHFIDIDFSLEPLRDEAGNVVFLVPSASVITQRKQMEDGLRESNAKFSLLANNITDAFWIRSPDLGEVDYISPAFERIWGRSVESLYAHPEQWVDFIVPDDRERVQNAFASLTKDVPAVDIEYRIARPDGEIRWVHVRGFQVRGPANELVGHTGIVTDITDRLRAAEALRTSEERFSGMLGNLELVATMVDVDARITYCNDYMLRLTGWERDEVIGRNWFELFIPPEIGDGMQGVYSALLADSPAAWHHENEIVTRSGTRMLVRWNNSLLRSASGEVIGIASIGEDITAAWRTGEALRISEERFRLLAKATNDAIWDWDLATNGLWWSEGFEILFGYEREAVDPTLKSWTERIHPDDLPRVMEDVHHVIDHAGGYWSGEYRFRRQDGSYAHVLDRAHIMRDGAGETIRMIGAMQDITEQKRAAEALQTSMEEFRSLAEAMPQIVWVTRADGWNIYINQHWMDYTGLTFEDGLGFGWNKSFHPDDQQGALHAWEQATATMGTFTIESRMRRADGAYRWWLIRGLPVLSPTGDVLKWFGTCTDIHDLKLAELEITRTNRALNAEMVERKRAETAAETANRAKSEFLANMSHEIRTPMNGVIGMTELALGTDLDDEQREYLGLVKESAESLMVVINDILDFSKIEAGKIAVDVVPFDLNESVATIVKALAAQAHAKGLGLAYEIQPNVPSALLGDPSRLRQVITNLVGNAIKFTEHGEVVLTVEAETQTREGALLRFSVSDTGIGIPQEHQEAIFNPFIQADGSTARKYGGTGLGLAISKTLVGLFGGRMWLESEPGKGSTFHFTARFGLQESSGPRSPSTEVRTGDFRGGSGLVVEDNTVNSPLACDPEPRLVVPRSREGRRSLRILVAEDNPVNQKVSARLLENRGHSVVIVRNGREALEALTEQVSGSFDLVLMDVQMPEMDGMEATRSIRQMEQSSGAHVPIIAMTAHSMIGDKERCLAAGMDGYASKPIQMKELLATIDRLLS